MLIDTHCHLNFQAFKADAAAVIRRALDANVDMVIVGTDAKSSKRAVQLAEKFSESVYAAVGLHPVHLQDQEFEEEGQKVKMKAANYERATYEKLARSSKVVGIGEIGLDYHYLPEENQRQVQQRQQLVLLQQLELAHALKKPAIIHCRDAHDDLLKLLRDFTRRNRWQEKRPRGVLHCFSGDWELAWQYFELGYIISFTGLVTFNKTWDEMLRKLPLDKFMVETDSPFMAPVPNRGKRNEPVNVADVVEHIAALKNVSFETVAEATTQNAQTVFRIA